MNGRGVNRAPGTVSGLLAIARLSSSSATLEFGGPCGNGGATHQWGEGSGWAGCLDTTTSLGTPRAHRFATGVSRKHIFSRLRHEGEEPKHVDLGWPPASQGLSLCSQYTVHAVLDA